MFMSNNLVLLYDGVFHIYIAVPITLCLGYIGMDRVISELCYKGTTLQKNYRKMTILWSFSYNFFVKFHGNKICQPHHD